MSDKNYNYNPLSAKNNEKTQKYIDLYKIHEDNALVCEEMNISEAVGMRILSNKHVFSVLAGEGCFFNSDSLFSDLPDADQNFINEFMIDFDGAAAAKRLGYKTPSVAARLRLTNPIIRFIIMCRQQELRDVSQVTSQAVLNEYAKIAFADIGEFLEFDKDVVTLKNSSEVDTSMISEVQSTQYGVKIKLHNKMAALEAVGKHLGMFKEKVEVTGADGDPIKIEANLSELRGKLDTIVERAKNQAVAELIKKGEASVVKENDLDDDEESVDEDNSNNKEES